MLGVKRRAGGFEEIAAAAQAMELPSASSVGMTISADIAPVDPAVVGALGMRTKVAGGFNMAPSPSGEGHPGWQRARRRRVGGGFRVAQLACGLLGEASEGFRFAFCASWLWGRGWGLAAAPMPMG